MTDSPKQLICDVWYHKMNDTMIDDEVAYKNMINVEKRLMLRLDGYTNAEIDTMIIKDEIRIPSSKERDVKRLCIRINDRKLSKKEQNELESKIDTRKIDWTPPPKDWWKNL